MTEVPTARLRLYDDSQEAVQAARASKAGADIEVHLYGTRHYLKKPGQPNIEPRFLCADGRWRKWDHVAELAATG